MFIVYFSFNFTLFHLRAVCPTLPRLPTVSHIRPAFPLLVHAYPARGVDSFYVLTVCQSHLTVAYISRRPMALNLDKSSVIYRTASASVAAIFSPFHFIPSAKLPSCQAAELGFAFVLQFATWRDVLKIQLWERTKASFHFHLSLQLSFLLSCCFFFSLSLSLSLVLSLSCPFGALPVNSARK